MGHAKVPKTADRFFAKASELWLLKMPFAPLAPESKWEATSSGDLFPHLYGRNFGANDVEEAKGFQKPEGQTWSDVLLESGWLV
jgi:uncharacterized protein (DUF952 family)